MFQLQLFALWAGSSVIKTTHKANAGVTHAKSFKIIDAKNKASKHDVALFFAS